MTTDTVECATASESAEKPCKREAGKDQKRRRSEGEDQKEKIRRGQDSLNSPDLFVLFSANKRPRQKRERDQKE